MNRGPNHNLLTRCLRAAGLCVALGLSTAASPPQTAPGFELSPILHRLSLDEYIGRLEDISSKLEGDAPAGDLAGALPVTWLVVWDGGQTWIRTEWLSQSLKSIDEAAEGGAGKREALRLKIAGIVKEANTVRTESETTGATIGAQFHLNKIMKRPEFGLVREATLWERLRFQVLNWLADMIYTAGKKSAGWLGWGRYLLWLLISALALLVLYAVVKNLRLRSTPQSVAIPIPYTVSKRSGDWWGGASDAARRGDLRTAVHDGYWAIITRMTEQGRWPQDYSRTHREYLGLLPRESELRESTAVVTLRFERSWYGGTAATDSDFEVTRTLWERLNVSRT